MAELLTTVKDIFAQKSVAVIGDLVADQYLNGTISRVSREAPVFILRHDETTTFPGGAANAAANVVSLGGHALAVGVIGNDTNGELLRSSLIEHGVDHSQVIIDPELTTTTKVRILAGQQHARRQQVIRVDYEPTREISNTTREVLLENVLKAIESADAVIVSDYNYGVAEMTVFEAAMRAAGEKNIPIVVDSRFRLAKFKGATSATPNQEEVEHILGTGFSAEDCSKLCRELGLNALIVTNGSNGMMVIEESAGPRRIAAVGPAQAVDVTGAGDTVIAAYALGLASGLPHFEAACLANHAGGVVVMKRGTATVSNSELVASIEAYEVKEARS